MKLNSKSFHTNSSKTGKKLLFFKNKLNNHFENCFIHSKGDYLIQTILRVEFQSISNSQDKLNKIL